MNAIPQIMTNIRSRGKLSVQFGFLAIFLSSCMGSTKNFFLINYEEKSVEVSYHYHPLPQDTTDILEAPKDYVLITNELLDKKAIKKFPYYRKSAPTFDTLRVDQSLLVHELTLPAKSTMVVPQPSYYRYDHEMEQIIIDQTHTIRLVQRYDGFENDELLFQDLAKYQYRFFGSSYYLVNIKLPELSKALQESE